MSRVVGKIRDVFVYSDQCSTLSQLPAWVLNERQKGGATIISSNTYGYIRVSTREQNEDRQIIALREMSIPEQNIFMDKQSGKDFNRPQYKKTGEKTQAGRFVLHQELRPARLQS